MKKIFKLPLLAKIVIAIVLGVLLGHCVNDVCVRAFLTFNGIFSQFLNFIVPLIIVGLVTPAIAEIGEGAGKMLLVTVIIAFADTILAGLLAYGTGSFFFPMMIGNGAQGAAVDKAVELLPYFELKIPPMIDVMSGLVFSFLTGLGIAYTNGRTLGNVFADFKRIISGVVDKGITPFLPLYIFGIFLKMSYTGEAYHVITVFAQIIGVIIVLHVVVLAYEYIVAGAVSGRNPLRLFITMLPAYFTALGTSSSAASIPVALQQTIKNRVSPDIAGFTIPLCATIHLSGSMLKITSCALAVCLINGFPHDLALFLYFIFILSICMVAAPGVPGGAIMAALGILSSVLGFTPEMLALMIALHISIDSFGTACNVTGDGAIAVIINKLFGKCKTKED